MLWRKYKLVLEFPEKEENIINLSDKQILEVVNKKTPEFLKEKILNGEKISAAEIRRERKNISSREEIFFKQIEEAEIIEDYEILIKKEFEEVMEALSKVENNNNYNKNKLDILIKVKKMLKEIE